MFLDDLIAPSFFNLIIMKGINFITDSKNRRQAVVINLKTFKKHEEEIEDLLDVIVAESRKEEPSVPWEEVKKNLKAKRKKFGEYG